MVLIPHRAFCATCCRVIRAPGFISKQKELLGTHTITACWRERLVETPAGEVTDLQWYGSEVVLHFRVSDEIVEAVLTFNQDGSVRRSRCGLFNNLDAARPPLGRLTERA